MRTRSYFFIGVVTIMFMVSIDTFAATYLSS